MSIYEGMFLVDNRHANRDWSRVVDVVKGLIAKHGGEAIRFEKWGERKLAYPIRGNKRGTYLLAYFEAEGEAPNAMYRDTQISFHDTFLRALILKVDAVPEVPEKESSAEGAKPATKAPEAAKESGTTVESEAAKGSEAKDTEATPPEADGAAKP